jgi:hypothetical protein
MTIPILHGPYFITTKKHSFEISIKEYKTYDYIHVGSSKFKFCIEISISKKGSIPYRGKLIQVKAEPECGYPTFLDKGDSISMLLATFQICKQFYPTVSIYEFEDDSHIECGIQSFTSLPPRKPIQPLSLAHLSIAVYGKTWYERHFNAKLLNSEKYKQYRNLVQALDFPIGNTVSDFAEFSSRNFLTEFQQVNLEPYFDTEKTWFEFFNSIPKKQHCELFYNWLPSCISKLLEDSYTNMGWYIDITTIPSIKISFTNNPVYKGGKRTTRKYRYRNKLLFSNIRQGSAIL